MVLGYDDAPTHPAQKVSDRARRFEERAQRRNLRFLTALALALGFSVLATIAIGAQRSPRPAPSRALRLLGYALIAVPLPLAVTLHLFLWPASTYGSIAFVVGVVAFGAGALLVLARDDEDEELEFPDDPDPAPWWPDFEREFHAYTRTARVPN
jgi:hypothetical protein